MNPTPPGRGRNLVLATTASTAGFWAWTVIAPLGARYAEELALTATQASVLVATPVLVGALGRIPVGALTDRYGGRLMFTAILLITAPAVVLVSVAGATGSYVFLVASAFLLGIGGTVFAVGIPFVSAWYEPSRRGFATGVFGTGMAGTALSAFVTPRLVLSVGYTATHLLIAGLLVLMATVVWFGLRESPGWVANTNPLLPKLSAAAGLMVTWQMSFLYAVVFGGFVAFSNYLPTYLRDIYEMDLTAAGTRTAGFALAAVLARPLGGIAADRYGAKPVVMLALGAVAVLAFVVNLRPEGEIPTGLTFLSMAAALGLGTGGVFAWVGVLAPADRVGAVGGLVSAAGGLGGFFPPIIMGATYNAAEKSYAIGLLLLVGTAIVAFVFTAVAVRLRPARRDR